MREPRLSVVIPTRNEEANIGACLSALRCSAFGDSVRPEAIVVDNRSPDRTREIASGLGARVFVQGPERCAQRNRGWREASGDWVLFLDADMTLPESTLGEILSIVSRPPPADIPSSSEPQAYYIPEVRDGSGLRAKARDFERGFYDGTCVDGLRLIRRAWLERIGGYDEDLVACEDWDLDRRLLAAGVRAGVLKGNLIHHEALVPLGKLLSKKAYYSGSVGRYRAKWHEDAVVRKQFGMAYRYFGVFVEHGKWRRILRHPLLATIMMFERILVGFVYVFNR